MNVAVEHQQKKTEMKRLVKSAKNQVDSERVNWEEKLFYSPFHPGNLNFVCNGPRLVPYRCLTMTTFIISRSKMPGISINGRRAEFSSHESNKKKSTFHNLFHKNSQQTTVFLDLSQTVK